MRSGVAWCGVVWSGVVWSGVVWSGVVWSGVEWCGVEWCVVVWSGVVWSGVVWCGVVWCGVEWCGVVWCGVVWSGVEWCGVEWCGVVWCGVMWSGVVWCGVVQDIKSKDTDQYDSAGEIWGQSPVSLSWDRLSGLVVKASTSRAEDPGFESRLRRDFSESSHTSDLQIGTPVATLPGALRYRVNAGTGRPGVSILRLGEVESLICNFYLTVVARKLVFEDPFLRYTSLLL